MANEKRLIDANGLLCLYNMSAIYEAGEYGLGCIDIINDIKHAPSVDAVMLSDLEAWLYEIAMNNVGEKFDGDFSDAVEEIINRLDGLCVFAAERRTEDGK